MSSYYKISYPSRVSCLVFGLFLFSSILMLGSCNNDNSTATLDPNFSFTYLDDNKVKFNNESKGDYYSLVWDFGNGQSETTTDKNLEFEIFYPEAGEYEVSLRVNDYVGNSKTEKKKINIEQTSLTITFTAEPLPSDPNVIKLTNLTSGQFDSFKWRFRNREVENETVYDAWLPFAGNHIIELVVDKNGTEYSEQLTVNIPSDDANYVDKLSLAWSDEFDGSEVNTDSWTFESGASGWGNNELQNYTIGENANVSDGILTITARKIDDNQVPGSYTSTRMITKGKSEFEYGRMEIRANLPEGRGIWPAIWMLGGNISTAGWPTCGEIDIMEYVGYQPNTVHATIHTASGFGGNGNGNSSTLVTCEEEFHIYGIIWTENEIYFYIDSPDNIIHTYAPSTKTAENWPFDQTAFFILNIAVGGNWGGAQGIDNSIFPQTMEIDYVRVYQESL